MSFLKPKFREADFRIAAAVCLALQALAWALAIWWNTHVTVALLASDWAFYSTVLGSWVFLGIPCWTLIAASYIASTTRHLRLLRLLQAMVASTFLLVPLVLRWWVLHLLILAALGVALPLLFAIDLLEAVARCWLHARASPIVE